MVPFLCTKWCVTHFSSPQIGLLLKGLGIDMPANRLEWPTCSNPPNGRRPFFPSHTGNFFPSASHHIQRLRFRCPSVEIYPSATGGPGASRRNGVGLLHCNKQGK